MRKIIRLTESDLHRIIKESVKKVIKEANWSNALRDPGQEPEYEDDWDDNPLDIWKRNKEDNL